MKVRLEQLQSNHNRIRTKVIEGECVDIPLVGRSFILTGPPMDPDKFSLDDGGRYFQSSKIVDVSKNGNEITFKTLNSVYKVTILE